MRGARLLVLIVFALLLPLAGGCGGSDADGSEEGSAEPTKQEFIEEADALCEQTDQTQKEAQGAFLKKYPDADSSTPWEEKFVAEVGLPPVQDLAEELDELAVPSGDEKDIQVIIDGMEEAVDKGLAEPSTLLEKNSAGPFTEVFKLAKEYGFDACATPL